MSPRLEVMGRVVAEVVAEPVEYRAQKVVGALVGTGAVLVAGVVVEVIDIARDEGDQSVPGQQKGQGEPRLPGAESQHNEDEQALLDKSPTIADRASHVLEDTLA